MTKWTTYDEPCHARFLHSIFFNAHVVFLSCKITPPGISWIAHEPELSFEPHSGQNIPSPFISIQIMNVYECNGKNIFMR